MFWTYVEVLGSVREGRKSEAVVEIIMLRRNSAPSDGVPN